MPTPDIESFVAELSKLWVRMVQLKAAAAAATTSHTQQEEIMVFQWGDRVRVKNKVWRPANWNQQAAQIATASIPYAQRPDVFTELFSRN